MTYFFDTYAIIELMIGNPSYNKYKNLPVKISVLNTRVRLGSCLTFLSDFDSGI
mgnify:CR=1 FL=1